MEGVGSGAVTSWALIAVGCLDEAYFGALVFLACCFVMIVQVAGAMRPNADYEFLCLYGIKV